MTHPCALNATQTCGLCRICCTYGLYLAANMQSLHETISGLFFSQLNSNLFTLCSMLCCEVQIRVVNVPNTIITVTIVEISF